MGEVTVQQLIEQFGEWEEDKHPRDHGKFAKKEGGITRRQEAGAHQKHLNTKSPYFKKWFKNSKVTNPDGTPMVVYHGTDQDFKDFDATLPSQTGNRIHQELYFTSNPTVAGDYSNRLATDPDYKALVEKKSELNKKWKQAVQDVKNDPERTKAGDSKWGNMEVSPTVKKAFDEYNEVVKELDDYIAEGRIGSPGANIVPAYLSIQNPVVFDAEGRNWSQVNRRAMNRAIRQGADGIIIKNVMDHANPTRKDPIDVYVVMVPNQVKSAVGNSGEYDEEGHNITMGEWDESRHPRGNNRNRGQFTRSKSPHMRAREKQRQARERNNPATIIQKQRVTEKARQERNQQQAANQSRQQTPSPSVASRVGSVMKVINVWPTLTAEVVKHSGAGDRTAKTAMVMATVLDNVVPMLPVGSLAIITLTSLVRPRAPVEAIQSLVERSEKAKQLMANARDLIQQVKAGRSKQMGEWEESKHPRGGDPKNKGRFSKGQGSNAANMESPAATKKKAAPKKKKATKKTPTKKKSAAKKTVSRAKKIQSEFLRKARTAIQKSEKESRAVAERHEAAQQKREEILDALESMDWEKNPTPEQEKQEEKLSEQLELVLQEIQETRKTITAKNNPSDIAREQLINSLAKHQKSPADVILKASTETRAFRDGNQELFLTTKFSPHNFDHQSLRRNINKANAFLSATVSGEHVTAPDLYLAPSHVRRFYDSNAGVVIGANQPPATIIHEFGHHLENSHPRIKSAIHDFWRKRTENSPDVSMKELNPESAYRDDEMGNADDWEKLFGSKDLAAYVGKVYRDANTGEITATEILSMGIEQIYRDPVNFAEKDPEYFQLVVSIMLGDFENENDD